MNIIATTIDNKTIDINNIFYMSIRKSIDAQAHSLSCIFSAYEEYPTIKKIRIIDNDFALFSGIVDTQKVTYDNNGLHISITGRSYSALLIDSEAMPTTYYMPSLSLIYDKNIAPYGLKGFKGDNKNHIGALTIPKGYSEWNVLQKFADTFVKVTPIIDENGIVDLTDNDKNSTVIIYYDKNVTSISKELNPYKIISKVIMRTKENSDYSLTINNNYYNTSLKKRYYNAVGENAPLYKGEQIINNTNNEYTTINLTYSGFLAVKLNNKMKIVDCPFSINDDLLVSDIKYTLSDKGKYTSITLKTIKK